MFGVVKLEWNLRTETFRAAAFYKPSETPPSPLVKNSKTLVAGGFSSDKGGVAQLARALDLHSRGRGFESHLLHH